MEASFLAELLYAVKRELLRFKGWVVLAFLAVSFAGLALGMMWPKQYETGAMLYADQTNIIEPLLKGRAEVTTLDRSEQARDIIYTRRILEQIASKAGLITDMDPVSKQEQVLSHLRKSIAIKDEGKSYFRILYRNPSQDISFRTLNTVVDVFISDAAERKRTESSSAFTFIDEQVNLYKRQLEVAEDRLKQFKSQNLYLTEGSVSTRVNELRSQIEELKLKVDELGSRRQSIARQLKNETQYVANRGVAGSFRDRIAALQTQLDALRLQYRDSYPDIVSLKDQILELELAMEQAQSGPANVIGAAINPVENPLYEELRLQLSATELDLNAQTKRLQTLERLLQNEYDRAEQVAVNEAELAELSRDYDVTKQIYEEMLERREKARLSMTLDIEGQGVSYKIQEPAIYPLQPSGLRFVHFFAAAPVAGLLAAIGLVVAFVMLDPRLRSPSLLRAQLPEDIELLGVIPHVYTPLSKRVFRSDVLVLLVVVVVGISIYGALGMAKLVDKL
ncbi:MAG: chain length-determining protein [Spongiibacteraceae bacterium]|jgi:polysaccharide chain length determinant protein (PEP-CTERM system associated)|nr:chain length-determining protein [Spongiibacteraceae bacterium]